MIAGAALDAGRLAHFDPEEANSLKAIANTRARVLLIHGTNDRKLPCSFSQALHQAATDHSDLILVDGADHNSITQAITGPSKDRFLRWLSST
jgi:pimeloyl-ACP methyl ester carboxylesterase